MDTTNERTKKDIYAQVTHTILEQLEAGAAEGKWEKPWIGGNFGIPLNVVSKKPYRGINVLLLWVVGAVRNYPTQNWATYRQWQQRGAQVRKGEKAASVLFWKSLDADDQEENEDAGEEEHKTNTRSYKGRVFARTYNVFNSSQVVGYDDPDLPELIDYTSRVPHIDAYFDRIGGKVVTGGYRAAYLPRTDTIEMPRYEAFFTPQGYYSTLAHEYTHWTGAKHRLHRDLSTRFGSKDYAAEELVAELGAAFMCASLGIAQTPRVDHVKYIKGWLELLRDDSRAILTAARHAQTAVDYLHSQAAAGEAKGLAA